MADNVAISAGTGTTIASDDIGGVQYQRSKMVWGVDGVAVDTSATNPLPVTIDAGSLAALGTIQVGNFPATQPVSGAVSVSNFPATQPVSGTFFQATQPVSTASLPLPTGAATETTLGSANTALGASTDAAATGNGSIIGVLKQLRVLLSAALTVTGTVVATVTGATLGAGTQLIGKVSSGFRTDKILSDTTELTPLFAPIAVSAIGANSIVAANATKKIRVLALSVMANGAVNGKFQSAATDKTGLYYMGANGGFVLPFNPLGWFETAVNEAMNLNLSAAVAVGGVLCYVEV